MACYLANMGISRVLLAFSVISACSSSPPGPAVDVDGGALIVMKEGDVLAIPLAVTPAIATQPGYVIVPGADTPDGFAAIAMSPSPQLVLTASCSLVHTGQGDASISFVVATDPASAAKPANVTVEVQGRDDGPCAPALRVWLSPDCSTPPADPTPARIAVAPIAGAQQVCVTAIAQDSAEQPTLSLTSAGPADRIVPAMQSATSYTVAVTAQNLRGLFDLDYTIDRGAIGVETGAVTLEIGSPGDASIDIVTMPAALPEFAVTTSTFRVFEYADPAFPGPLCVRESRVAPPVYRLANPKQFLKLHQIGAPRTGFDGDWVQGSAGTYSLDVSPFVDAKDHEDVLLDLIRDPAGATGTCAIAGTPPADLASATIGADVTNLAEMWSSPY